MFRQAEVREGGGSLGVVGVNHRSGELLKRGVEARIESMSPYRYFSLGGVELHVRGSIRVQVGVRVRLRISVWAISGRVTCGRSGM